METKCACYNCANRVACPRESEEAIVCEFKSVWY